MYSPGAFMIYTCTKQMYMFYIYILEYSYSKYCSLIGQLQGTIFCSALIQGTIFIVPARFDSARTVRRQHTYCALQLIIIIIRLYT